jgi:acetylornithine/N-succinyldiaminopimelate aminotransferase
LSNPILPTYNRYPLSFVKGSGSWLETDMGDKYLDFGSGIAVTCLGHAHPKLVAVLKNQAEMLWHTSNLFRIPNQEELAKKLVVNTFADKVFFTNSGTESIECAIKMARKYQFEKGNLKKNRIITFEGSFHGRSIAAISSSGAEKLVKGFYPLLDGFDRIPLNNSKKLIEAVSENTAAIMIEPIIGEGGIKEIPRDYMCLLRKICDENDLLLICDEIQSGIGRSGKFFAHEFSGIKPDIVATAKGLGGGFPLGACLATKEAAFGMVAGSHGSTYGGNPLACSVALAVLDEIYSKGFLKNVLDKAKVFKTDLKKIITNHPKIYQSISGLGFMLGIKCSIENTKVIQEGLKKFIILIPCGDNMVRLLPPLNISDEDLREGISKLDKIAQDLESDI